MKKQTQSNRNATVTKGSAQKQHDKKSQKFGENTAKGRFILLVGKRWPEILRCAVEVLRFLNDD